MRIFALIASLCISSAMMAGNTIVLPIEDLLFEIPQFDNAPRFDLNAVFQGKNPIRESTKEPIQKTRKQREAELIQLLVDEFPEATSVRIWRGNAIIKFSNS